MIDWNKIEHAYGQAGDVPAMLEELAGGASAERLQAAIVHQGTVYPAAYHAVEPLLALLAAGTNPGNVLPLLTAIAVGQTYIDPRSFRAPKLLASPPKKTPSGASLTRACYHAVGESLPRVRELLRHHAAEVRIAAAFHLAWFPADAKPSGAALLKSFGTEEHPGARASMALALACLKAPGAATLLAAQAPGNDLERDAFAVALAMLEKPNADLAAAARSKPRPDFPWGDGAVADLAVGLLGSARGSAKLEGLLEATRAGNEDAAKKLLKLVFPKVASAKLEPDQQRAIEALLDGKVFTSEVVAALESRKLPTSVRELSRRVGRQVATRPTPLADLLTFGDQQRTLAEHLKSAVQQDDAWRALADAALQQLPPARMVHAAADVDELLEIKGMGAPFNRALLFALRTMAAAAPRAPEAVREADARVRKDPGTKDNPFGGSMPCESVKMVVAVGLARVAMAKGETVDARVRKMLAAPYREEVSASLGAIDPEERDAWILARDDEKQPSVDDPYSPWHYYVRWPSARVTEHVLASAAKWKPKDPWGKPRAQHADPWLKRYADALRAAGEDADAERCEALLS